MGKQLADINYEREEIWHCDGNHDMFQFLKEQAITVFSDGFRTFLCIDGEVLENIMVRIKEKIDETFATSDKCDVETYETGNPLYTWSKLYTVLRKFQLTYHQQEWCLFVDAGW